MFLHDSTWKGTSLQLHNTLNCHQTCTRKTNTLSVGISIDSHLQLLQFPAAKH
jgi:hypothetical protein